MPGARAVLSQVSRRLRQLLVLDPIVGYGQLELLSCAKTVWLQCRIPCPWCRRHFLGTPHKVVSIHTRLSQSAVLMEGSVRAGLIGILDVVAKQKDIHRVATEWVNTYGPVFKLRIMQFHVSFPFGPSPHAGSTCATTTTIPFLSRFQEERESPRNELHSTL